MPTNISITKWKALTYNLSLTIDAHYLPVTNNNFFKKTHLKVMQILHQSSCRTSIVASISMKSHEDRSLSTYYHDSSNACNQISLSLLRKKQAGIIPNRENFLQSKSKSYLMHCSSLRHVAPNEQPRHWVVHVRSNHFLTLINQNHKKQGGLPRH